MTCASSSWIQGAFFWTDLPETLIPVVAVRAAALKESGAVGSTHRVPGTDEGCGTTLEILQHFRRHQK